MDAALATAASTVLADLSALRVIIAASPKMETVAGPAMCINPDTLQTQLQTLNASVATLTAAIAADPGVP